MRTSALLCLVLSSGLLAACGAPKNAENVSAAAELAAQATNVPALPGTPMPLCPQRAAEGLAASSTSEDAGFNVYIGTFDEERAHDIQARAAEQIEARQQLEAQLHEVQASQHDDGNGIYVRFEHGDAEVLNVLADILQSGIDKRPAAARRVDVRRAETHVDMQLPGGGPLITSKTSEAAQDAVRKWTKREPTELELETTVYGIRIGVRSSDPERLHDLRSEVLRELLRCDEP